MESVTESGHPRLSRRDALKRGAVVGGALVWTVPAIQTISLTAARAESPSGPPVRQPPVDGVPVEQPSASPTPVGTGPAPSPSPSPSPHEPPPLHHRTGTPSTAGAASSGNTAPGADTFAAAGGTDTAAAAQGAGALANTGPGIPVVPAVVLAAGLIATGFAAQAARPQPARPQPPSD